MPASKKGFKATSQFWLMNWKPTMRQRISKELGIELYDIYGLTEIYGPGIGINCKYNTGMHCWEDYLYIEIIDPKTLKPVEYYCKLPNDIA